MSAHEDAAILNLGLGDLAGAIRNGDIRSEAAVGAALRRAEALQPKLNAFLSMEADEALEQARSADKARAAGGAMGPLHGVPLAHKDMFWRAGKVMTGGSPILADFRPDATSTLMERLEGAGAITIGTLNMCEFAASPTGRNPHVGDACNPHDPTRVTGGSSSGSATAVAAGIVPAALGSDTGGSVRIPAAVCGTVGLKPTYGRVSNHGSIPRAYSLDCVGPLVRHAADAALMLSVIAGHDPRDATTAHEPVPAATLPKIDLAELSVVVAEPATITDASPDVMAEIAKAVEALASTGVRVEHRPLPDFTQLFALGDTVSKCEAAALHRRWMTERPDDYSKLTYERTLAGFLLPATRYIEALMLRGRLTQEFLRDTLGDADALLLPSVRIETPTIAEIAEREAAGDILSVISSFTRLTRPINYLGLPALSVPCGTDTNGMPVAFQLVGRPFSEPFLCALGDHYEREIGFGIDAPKVLRELAV